MEFFALYNYCRAHLKALAPSESEERIAEVATFLVRSKMVRVDDFGRLDFADDTPIAYLPQLPYNGTGDRDAYAADALGRLSGRLPPPPVAAPSGTREEQIAELQRRADATSDRAERALHTIRAAELRFAANSEAAANEAQHRADAVVAQSNARVEERRDLASAAQARHTDPNAARASFSSDPAAYIREWAKREGKL